MDRNCTLSLLIVFYRSLSFCEAQNAFYSCSGSGDRAKNMLRGLQRKQKFRDTTFLLTSSKLKCYLSFKLLHVTVAALGMELQAFKISFFGISEICIKSFFFVFFLPTLCSTVSQLSFKLSSVSICCKLYSTAQEPFCPCSDGCSRKKSLHDTTFFLLESSKLKRYLSFKV